MMDFSHHDASEESASALVEYALAQTEHASKPAASHPEALVRPEDAVPGYDLVKVLHRGGQGVVYRAVQQSTGKLVALKVLRDGAFSNPLDRLRLEREAQILARLEHPSIVAIRDAGFSAGHSYFVMDYLDGLPLDEYVRTTGLSLPDTLRVFVRICEAVHTAHVNGVIHRDLKPSNIRVTRDGVPHVLDFGVAKIFEPGHQTAVAKTMTETGQFVGSLPWASPEQARGDWHRVDTRTDIYSLGVMLYQLVTGHFPYPVTGSVAEVSGTIAISEPARPSTFGKRVDHDLETILLGCLQKDPERRYQNVSDLARDLRRYLDHEPIEAKRDSTWYVLTKKLRRYRVALAISVALAAIGGIGLATMAVLYRGKVRAEHTAAERLADTQREASRVAAMDQFMTTMLGSANSRSEAQEIKFVDLLARAEEYIAASLQGQPLLEASLRMKVADAYRRLWMHDLGEPHLRAALRIRTTELGPNHPDTLMVLDRLALCCNAGEKVDEAESLFRESLARHRTLLDEDNPLIVWKKMYLADILEKKRNLDGADDLYREALDSFTRVPGDGFANYFNAANNYLVFLLNQNRIAQAEVLAQAAVSLLEKHAGTDDAKTTHMRSNWARVLTRLGRLQEAEVIYRALLDDHRRQYGEKSVGGFIAYTNNLAEILRDRNELDEAERLFRQGFLLQSQEHGDNERASLLLRTNLADLLALKGEFEEAEQVAREAIRVAQRFLGETSPEAAETELVLGEILLGTGRVDEAGPLLANAAERLDSGNGPADRSTLLAMSALGKLHLARGDVSEAERVYERAIAGGGSVLPDTHWILAALRRDHGWCLSKLGRREQAGAELLSGASALLDGLGEDHPETRRAMEYLAAHYDAVGDPIRAAKYRRAGER